MILLRLCFFFSMAIAIDTFMFYSFVFFYFRCTSYIASGEITSEKTSAAVGPKITSQKSRPMGANTTWHCCYTQQFSRSKKLLVTFFCWSFFVAVYSSTVSILQRCFWRWSLKMVILSPLSLLFEEEALEWSEAWVMRDEGAEERL